MSGTAARKAAREHTVATPPRRSGVAGSGSSTVRSSPSGTSSGTARPPSRRELDPDRLVALEEERDFLLRSITDLDAEHAAGDIDDDDHAALRDDYTRRAAAVLRAIEEREEAMVAGRGADRPGRKVAALAGVVVFALVAGGLMAAAAGRRGAGDTMTGDNRQSCRQGVMDAQAQMRTAPAESLKAFDAVIEQCPDDPEALTYKGWLLYNVGIDEASGADGERLVALALQTLDLAVAADATFTDAHVFRAIVYRRLGRLDEARAEIAVVDPDRIPPFMQEMVAGFQAGLEGPSGSTPGTAPGTTPGTTP